MAEQKTIQFKGFQIRLTENNAGQLQPNANDIARFANLEFLLTYSSLSQIYSYFIESKYSQACKFVCYHEDTTLPIARERILKFLLISFLCVFNFVKSEEQKKDALSPLHQFICGLTEENHSFEDILILIVDLDLIFE